MWTLACEALKKCCASSRFCRKKLMMGWSCRRLVQRDWVLLSDWYRSCCRDTRLLLLLLLLGITTTTTNNNNNNQPVRFTMPNSW